MLKIIEIIPFQESKGNKKFKERIMLTKSLQQKYKGCRIKDHNTYLEVHRYEEEA